MSTAFEKNADEKETSMQVKTVKQIFEKVKCDDSAAPAGVAERRRVRMSANIELLQRKLTPKEESDQSKTGKSNDTKQIKLLNSRPKCTWTPGAMVGVARKRSKSRFPATTKKMVAVGQSSKKERPYRQWLGVSPCVTNDCKYIISSKPSRHSLEMNAVESAHSSKNTKANCSRNLRTVRDDSNSPERLMDTMPSKHRTCVSAHQVHADQSRPTDSNIGLSVNDVDKSRLFIIKDTGSDGQVYSRSSDDDCESISKSYTISEQTKLLENDSQKASQQQTCEELFNQRSTLEVDSPNETATTTSVAKQKETDDQKDTDILPSKPKTEIFLPLATESESKNTEPFNSDQCKIQISQENVCTDYMDSNIEDPHDTDSVQLNEAHGSQGNDHRGNTPCTGGSSSLDQTPSNTRVTDGESSTVADTETVTSAGQFNAIVSSANSAKVGNKSSFLETLESVEENKNSVENTSNMDTSEILLSDLSWQEYTDDESLESESCFKFNINAGVKGPSQQGYKRMTWRSRMEKSSSLKSNLYPRFDDGCCWADFNTRKRELNRVFKKKSIQATPSVEQSKITPQHSTTETSHIKGLSTPETKRKPSPISPSVAGVSSSKRPMLRTAARACQRSRRESPCTNNADTTSYSRWTPVCTPNGGRVSNINKLLEQKLAAAVCSIGTETDKGQLGDLTTLTSSLMPANEFTKSKTSETVGKSENQTDSVHLPKHNKHKSVGARQLLQKINWTSKHDQKQDYKLVQAIMDFRGTLPGQLSFRKGQIIRQRCETETQESDLCYGSYSVGRLKKKRKGLFPAYCVAEYTPPS